MKRNLTRVSTLLAFFLFYLFISLLFMWVCPIDAKPLPPQNIQVKLVKPPSLLTENQVKNLIEQQTKTVGQHKVITLAKMYADYGNVLVNILIRADDYVQPIKNSVFNKNDLTFFIKANTTYILSHENIFNGGATMLGIAILDNKRVVTLLIEKNTVYIYDTEGHLFKKPRDYITAGYKFTLIII